APVGPGCAGEVGPAFASVLSVLACRRRRADPAAAVVIVRDHLAAGECLFCAQAAVIDLVAAQPPAVGAVLGEQLVADAVLVALAQPAVANHPVDAAAEIARVLRDLAARVRERDAVALGVILYPGEPTLGILLGGPEVP